MMQSCMVLTVAAEQALAVPVHTKRNALENLLDARRAQQEPTGRRLYTRFARRGCM